MTKKKSEQSSKSEASNKKATKGERNLQKLVDELSIEKDELFGKLQRISADYANYQKRAPKQIADSVAYEKKAIIKTLLPCLDNFEHTLGGAESGGIEEVIKGIKIVFDHILDVLKSHGVEIIEAMEKEFDPTIHEAVMQRKEEDKAGNIVLEEFQKGYMLNGKVIRPSKVIVNKLPEENDDLPDSESQQETQED